MAMTSMGYDYAMIHGCWQKKICCDCDCSCWTLKEIDYDDNRTIDCVWLENVPS